ncbi:amidohydrolase family protein, partial [Mesorhizobium sp. M7D.F.Ca.US.004.01.2.1]
MSFDLVIKNANVVTASDTFRSDIGISGGKIVALACNLNDGREIIDADGLLALPGGIDSHVHLEQPGPPEIVMADSFESGTLAAAFGGNTTVMPFCLQQKGMGLRQSLVDYHAAAEGMCHTDVSFHLIISDPTPSVLGQELPALVEAGYTSLKVFMTYDDLVLNDRQMLEVMAAAKETGALVMVHAEGYDTIRFLAERLERAGKTA